jgi:hypothetical protein
MPGFMSMADFQEHYAEITASPEFAAAFGEEIPMAQLSPFDEPTQAPLPDDGFAEFFAGSMAGAPFELLADTRLERYAERIAWGIVNSLHMVANQIEREEDDAAKKLGELARNFDPSEIYQNELEETQRICQSLHEARGAIEAMRDHAAAKFRTETGRPWTTTKGSRVASGLTASQIDAKAFLAARAQQKRDQLAPEGPLVAISGGAQWEDSAPIIARLDACKKRIPNMLLATTAQAKGVDAIAAAWAAANDIKVIAFRLDRNLGNRAAFERNRRLVALRPVELIICEGSGVQINLAQRARDAGLPVWIIRKQAMKAAA